MNGNRRRKNKENKPLTVPGGLSTQGGNLSLGRKGKSVRVFTRGPNSKKKKHGEASEKYCPEKPRREGGVKKKKKMGGG